MNSYSKTIIISGAPGSGKTTLAKPLAERLNFALISKDFIKETLADKIGLDYHNLDENRKIGGASMEVMWKLAKYSPKVILEANFRPYSQYEREKIKAIGGQIIEIYCKCSPKETQRRFAERAKKETHHPVHIFKELSLELLAKYNQPVGIGKVTEVNTEQSVNIEKLASKIEKLWTEK